MYARKDALGHKSSTARVRDAVCTFCEFPSACSVHPAARAACSLLPYKQQGVRCSCGCGAPSAVHATKKHLQTQHTHSTSLSEETPANTTHTFAAPCITAYGARVHCRTWFRATGSAAAAPWAGADGWPGSALAHRRWRSRPVVALLLFLGATVGFAFAAYRARHSGRDLAFAIVTYYLLVVLACCVAKLRQLQRDPAAAATAAQRRRVRIGTWVVSVALGTTVTSRVTDAMPGLALKLVVWGVSVVLHGLVLYFLFLRNGAEGCDAEELGCGQADAGRRPATALRGELSPEEKV